MMLGVYNPPVLQGDHEMYERAQPTFDGGAKKMGERRVSKCGKKGPWHPLFVINPVHLFKSTAPPP